MESREIGENVSIAELARFAYEKMCVKKWKMFQ